MILTGPRIAEAVRAGSIHISPFHEEQLNPNSYNYRLDKVLRVYRSHRIDALAEQEFDEITIGDRGFLLQPGRVYLGTTVEEIGGADCVPLLIGRSSLGRLGMFLQISADMGNVGAVHRWTLEIVVVQPLRVYAGMLAGQVSFWTVHGAREVYDGYFGRYNTPELPQAALL